VRGVARPKELAHAELVTGWVLRLRPDAGPDLLLAARAHHLCRWMIPSSSHPSGRRGYPGRRRALHTCKSSGSVGYSARSATTRRRLVANHWTYPHRPGRRSTEVETRQTIMRLARENPTWAYRRIHGELARLGITIAASTVWAILKNAGVDPAPVGAENSSGPLTCGFVRAAVMGVMDLRNCAIDPNRPVADAPGTSRDRLTGGPRDRAVSEYSRLERSARSSGLQ
jgi:hypothetical protein